MKGFSAPVCRAAPTQTAIPIMRISIAFLRSRLCCHRGTARADEEAHFQYQGRGVSVRWITVHNHAGSVRGQLVRRRIRCGLGW